MRPYADSRRTLIGEFSESVNSVLLWCYFFKKKGHPSYDECPFVGKD